VIIWDTGPLVAMANQQDRHHARCMALFDDASRPIAVNIERLSQPPPGESTAPRPPTGFQDHLDQHNIKRLRLWRAVG
jgi:hypothetical protein